MTPTTPPTPAPPPARPNPGKKDHVAVTLRQQIVAGQLKPRTQLPNQSELVRTFGVSTVTIQRAIEQLARDGFVESRPRRGVFVHRTPPHLAHYCLIFPHDPAHLAQHNRFLFSLSQLASGLATRGARRASVYHGVEHDRTTDAWRQLMAQVESSGTAGLVFLSRPAAFVGTPLLTQPGVPRVAIMNEAVPGSPDIAAVRLGPYADSALDWLAQQQCRQLAMVTVPQTSEAELRGWMQGAAARGMALARQRVLAVPREEQHWAQHAVRALLDRPRDDWPDGLLITDDNLVPQATAGLLAAGVRVPEECRVVAHGNFPWATQSLVPAKRFGPDTRQVLKACIDLIDAARRGDATPKTVTLPMFADDQVPDEPQDPGITATPPRRPL